MNPPTIERCGFCGQALEVVWVHGHGQCRHCHTNIAPCCDGACEVTDKPGARRGEERPSGSPREEVADAR